MARPQEYLVGRRDLDHPAGIHDADAVGDLRQQGQVVRYIQHRDADPDAQLAQQRDDLLLGGDVEAGRRLVQHQQSGSQATRHRDTDALLLPARQLVRIATLEARIGRQSDQLEDAHNGAGILRVLDAAMRQHGLGQLPPDANARVERGGRVLRHEGDPVAAQFVQLAPRHRGESLALEPDVAVFQPHRHMAKASSCSATVDFPQPDSPTSPNTSPGRREKLTSSTARDQPPPCR
jgi:hypothetical protein